MIRELLDRRVPQILGAYLAAGWLVLEVTDWVVNRYVLSSHLADFVAACWVLLLPSVLLMAWFHGRPGRDRWTRFERIGIAANFILAGLVLFGVFHGRDLGAATTTVVIEDEEGNAVERVVPKSEFRKSLVVFPFDDASGDPERDWLQFGLPIGVSVDLTQDQFLNVVGAERWMPRLRQEGFPDGLDVPLTLKRIVAERLHADHFTTGVIGDSAGVPTVTVTLYETRRARRLGERVYRGEDALVLADRISRHLREDLDLPAQHLEETADLPAAELLTTEPGAYRAYVTGERAALERRDYPAAKEAWESAVTMDPTFAFAWLRLYQARTLLNDAAGGQEALDRAMKLLYRLPERVQYPVKAIAAWLVERDLDRAVVTSEAWAELYPDDVDAQLGLARYYAIQGRRDEAIARRERVLELDPSRVDQWLAIGGLRRAMGEYDGALAAFRRYQEAAPESPDGYVAIGDLHRRLGDFAAARQAFNRALAIDPGDVGALIRMAYLHADLGEFGEAESGFTEALEAGTTPEERAAAYGALQGYAVFRGRMREAFGHQRRKWEELARVTPPFDLVQTQMNDLELYARAGRTAAGQAVLDSLRRRIPPEFEVIGAIGSLSLALDGTDPDAIAAAREEFARFLEDFGIGEARYALTYADGRVAELRGNCREAIRQYGRALELNPDDPWVKRGLGRCQGALGDSRAARESFEELLRIVPVQPQVHAELARVLADEGDADEAVDHLRTASGVWEDADPDYPDARAARALLRELERAR
jgi:tetratricopeptide (TPR) repeat protein